MRRSARLLSAGLVSCAALLACASGPAIIDASLPPVEDPDPGPAVRIGSVVDRRVFQRYGHDLRRPSSRGGLPSPELARRLVGRNTRPGTGRAWGNVLLPEGRSVEMLVREALARAFREAGYRVIEPGAPGADEAFPVSADILQLWTRVKRNRRIPNVTFESDVIVTVVAPLGYFRVGAVVRGRERLTRAATTEASWKKAVEGGLLNFAARLRDQLPRPDELPPPRSAVDPRHALAYSAAAVPCPWTVGGSQRWSTTAGSVSRPRSSCWGSRWCRGARSSRCSRG